MVQNPRVVVIMLKDHQIIIEEVSRVGVFEAGQVVAVGVKERELLTIIVRRHCPRGIVAGFLAQIEPLT
ncbi:MAG: hypothetical protein LBK69_04125, partial [Syntrophomonadaceae bacterium]|nr:hypothetical protein [Syntrophomonadaceae bacterium]